MPVVVSETFFSVLVSDKQRATEFYVNVLGAAVVFAAPAWTSLRIAGVRLGLALVADHAGERTGLHFAVPDITEACAQVERAGGRIVHARLEPAPGVILAEVTDTEGNVLTLTQR